MSASAPTVRRTDAPVLALVAGLERQPGAGVAARRRAAASAPRVRVDLGLVPPKSEILLGRPLVAAVGALDDAAWFPSQVRNLQLQGCDVVGHISSCRVSNHKQSTCKLTVRILGVKRPAYHFLGCALRHSSNEASRNRKHTAPSERWWAAAIASSSCFMASGNRIVIGRRFAAGSLVGRVGAPIPSHIIARVRRVKFASLLTDFVTLRRKAHRAPQRASAHHHSILHGYWREASGTLRALANSSEAGQP